MPARLTIHFPRRPGRELFLDEGRAYVVGRGEECDVRLDDPRLSRRHAGLQGADGAWTLRDLGSKNGVTVDGRKVGDATLDASAWIGFGGLLARFERVSDEARRRLAEAARRRRQSSLELRASLGPGQGCGAILERVLDAALELTGTERGFVMLATERGDMEVLRNRGLCRAELEGRDFSGSVGAIELALREQSTVVTCDAGTDPRLAERPSVELGGIRALICAPLVASDRVLGALYADSRSPGKVFTELDAEIFGGLVEHAALALGASRLEAEVAALARRLREDGGVLSWSGIRAARDAVEGGAS